MPKTNHNRNFRDERDYTVPGGDFCRGKHGAAKNKRGQKKFRRSRQRFHQNQQVTAMVDEDVSLMPTKHDNVLKGHSKLRVTSGSRCNPMVCTQCGKECNILVIVVPLERELCKACKSQLP
jgi:hypothetical protein